jgi:hypothetical protein
MEYLFFDEDLIYEVGAHLEHTSGDTADDYVNKNWHRDVMHLSAANLASMAARMVVTGEQGDLLKQELSEHIREAMDNDWIDTSRVNGKMRHEIGRLA